jgi:serine/threonine protein kinase
VSSVGITADSFIGTPYWMAPEVINTDPDCAAYTGASYDAKVDIYSIGITAIELAERNPPFSELHPMRALLLIPTADINLTKPKSYTRAFQEFVLLCLSKDPKKRPGSSELIRHPFLAKSSSIPRQKVILDLIQKSKIARERRKAGLDDNEEESISFEIPSVAIYETMRIAKLAQTRAQTPSSTSQSVRADLYFLISGIPYLDKHYARSWR